MKRHARRAAGALVLLVLGCESAPTAQPGVDAAARADVSEAGVDARADGGVTFHGVAVGDWDRSMPDVDAIGYEVDLRVDESTAGAETFRAELRGVFVATRTLDALALDYTGDEVDGAEVDGRAATPARDGGVLTVPLGRAVPAGGAFAVTVRYHGRLFQGGGVDPNDFERFGGLMAFQRNRAGRKIYESLNWPSKARRWLPVRDHPRDGAMVALRATFPERYTVLANGRMERMTSDADGTRTWQYFCATPMPAYDIHVAAYDDWAETAAMSAGGRAMRWLPYSGDRAAGETLSRGLPEAMDFYEGAFGPFRWEQAAFIEAPIFGGAMEHATLVSMDETLFRAPERNRPVSYHELAHHWSGNLVRIATWNDFWLSEGFADYLTGRFLDAHDGPAEGLRRWRGYIAQALAAERGAARHPLRPPMPEVDVLTIFDAVSYKKGALVLRMLERRLGAEAFTAFLRGWFERHAGRAALTQTFEAELDAAFPGRGVRDFFAQWVYGEGHPVLEVSSRHDMAAGRLTLTLRQTQARGPAGGFRLPVTVEFARGATRERAVVELTGMTTTTEVPLSFAPERITVDPDETLYLAVACSASSPCREGYTCAALGTDPAAVCAPPR